MNLLAKKFLATTALALAFPAMAMAELPGPLTNLEAGVTEEVIRDGLTELGYTDITYIAGAGDYYTVRAHYNSGYVPLLINTATGEITQPGLPDNRTLRLLRGTGDDSIKQGLMELGYSVVSVDAREGRYVDATAWRYGEAVKLTVDLETGTVENLDHDDTWYVAMRDKMTNDEVRAELEAMGYTEIIDLDKQGSYYEGYGIQNGQRVKILVDAVTGEVRGWNLQEDS